MRYEEYNPVAVREKRAPKTALLANPGTPRRKETITHSQIALVGLPQNLSIL